MVAGIISKGCVIPHTLPEAPPTTASARESLELHHCFAGQLFEKPTHPLVDGFADRHLINDAVSRGDGMEGSGPLWGQPLCCWLRPTAAAAPFLTHQLTCSRGIHMDNKTSCTPRARRRPGHGFSSCTWPTSSCCCFCHYRSTTAAAAAAAYNVVYGAWSGQEGD